MTKAIFKARQKRSLSLATVALGFSALAHAHDERYFIPQLLGAQYTLTQQHQGALHSPYAGSLSLHPDGDTARSHTFGAYFGMPLTAHLQFYFDLEMFKGEGVSGSTGLGGLTNGDVIRSGTATLGKRPYVARRYLRYVVPLGCEAADVPRGMAICRLPIMAIPACSRVTVGAMVARNRLPSPKWIAA